MSDFVSSVPCLYNFYCRGIVRIVNCVVLVMASLSVKHALAGNVPQQPPPPSPPSSRSRHDKLLDKNGTDSDDDEDDSPDFDFLKSGEAIFITVVLLVVLLAAVTALLCWMCWRRRRRPTPHWMQYYPQCTSAPQPAHNHLHCQRHAPAAWSASPCECRGAPGAGSRVTSGHVTGGNSLPRSEGRGARGLERGGPVVSTIYDPARCHCACAVMEHLPSHLPPRGVCCRGRPISDGGTSPDPPRLAVPDVTQAVSEGGRRSDAERRTSRSGDQSVDILNPLSVGRSPGREITLPVASHARNDITAGSDVNGRTAQRTTSLSSRHTSDQTPPPSASYNSFDDNVALTSSSVDVPVGPMNIEVPGLFQTFPQALRDLFVPGQRSEMRTVAGKLVVSLARLVDSKGDVLVLDNMGISLQVPPGAVPSGQRQLVSLVLNWDLGDNPVMDNTQALVSPVVCCGPHGLKLDKPCILSYKHCAFDTRMVQVLSSQTELVEQKDWQVLCSADDSSGAVAMTTDECQVRLQHFSLFTCIQTPPPGTTGKKWLQVAAFCAPLQRHVHHYQVRVYFLNKTPCALQWAIQNEARFGFRLACPERTFLMHGSGESIHLTVNYVSRGWADEDEDGTVPYHSVWHGQCPHLSFCFKRSCLLDDRHRAPWLQPQDERQRRLTDTSFPARVDRHVSEISLDLSVFQDSSSNCPDRLNLLLTEVPRYSHMTGDTPLPACAPTQLLPACDKHPISISMPAVPIASGGKITGKVHIDPKASAGPNVLVDFEQEHDCMPWPLFAIKEEEVELEKHTGGVGVAATAKGGVANTARDDGAFPQELKLKLKLKLDPPSAFGNDWKLLASKLGLDKYIHWLASRDNPTLNLLQYAEAKRMTLPHLHGLLLDINRQDAAAEVRSIIDQRRHGQTTMTSRVSSRGRDPHRRPPPSVPAEGSDSGSGDPRGVLRGAAMAGVCGEVGGALRWREEGEGLTEDSGGLREEGEGLTEDSGGLREEGEGLTEDSGGLREEGEGLTEDSGGLRKKEKKDMELFLLKLTSPVTRKDRDDVVVDKSQQQQQQQRVMMTTKREEGVEHSDDVSL